MVEKIDDDKKKIEMEAELKRKEEEKVEAERIRKAEQPARLAMLRGKIEEKERELKERKDAAAAAVNSDTK